MPSSYNIIKAPSPGKLDSKKELPQSGMEYLVNYLYRFLSGEAPKSEEAAEKEIEELPVEEFIDQRLKEPPPPAEEEEEEYEEDYEEDYEEEPIAPGQFNRWRVIMDLIKNKLELFFFKLMGLMKAIF